MSEAGVRSLNDAPVVFVGHPFTSIGKGEELRSSFKSYSYLDPRCEIMDVFKHAERTDRDYLSLVAEKETNRLGQSVRIFHINGDEVSKVFDVLRQTGHEIDGGTNVIVPAWELPEYPDAWTPEVAAFDEVWAISRFVQDSLAASGINARYVGQSAEVAIRAFLPRRYFGIRASSFVFLTFVDLSSYPERKNPHGVLQLFREYRKRHPYEDVQLVVKAKKGEQMAREWIEDLAGELEGRMIVINQPLSQYETQSLIAACDCFVSLHRSEGFGRVIAEAMWLGRLALATGWSGNMDYMDGYPCLVDYELKPVGDNDYPHGAGQVWADPDVDHALWIVEKMTRDSEYRAKARSEGLQSVRTKCSNRAVGLRMLSRVKELQG